MARCRRVKVGQAILSVEDGGAAATPAPAAKVAPESVKPVPLGAAVTLPPQVVAPAGAAVFTTPAG